MLRWTDGRRQTRPMGLFAAVSQIVRLRSWWDYKIPPLALVAYLVLAENGVPAGPGMARLLALVAVIALVASYGYVVNDVCDAEADHRAGRPRAVTGLARARQWALAAALASASLVPFAFGILPHTALLIVIANLAVATLYSVPPIRLKTRGVSGLLTDAAGVQVLPTALFALGAAGTPLALPATLLVPALVWSACWGVRGIFIHQLWDRVNDRNADVQTMVTTRDPSRARWIFSRVVLPIELAAFCMLGWSVAGTSPQVLILGLLYVPLDLVRFRLVMDKPFDPVPARSGSYIPPSDLYEVWLPVVTAATLVLVDWRYAPVLVVHTLLFARELRRRGREVVVIVRKLWRLAGAGRAGARPL